MSMVCPQCNGSFDQRIQCPACGVRLLYQATARSASAGLPGQAAQWQHTPWGRLFVGLLLAQGLYHGLQQLCTAGLLAITPESSREVWATLFGLMLQQGLQGFGLLVGGILAGAGQRRGILIGAALGAVNYAILVALEHFTTHALPAATAVAQSQSLTAVTAYGQPLLLTAFGAVGGLIGSLIWRPLPRLTMPGQPASKVGVKFSAPSTSSLLSGPVSWIRVVLGIAVAVAGTSWAHVILKAVLDTTDGKLSISSRLQAHLVTMEICALAVLIGSSLAGATTVNGLKQGLFVGIGATVVLLGLQLKGSLVVADRMIYTGLSTSFLALAGGWFGGQLFPPVFGRGRRKTMATAMVP